MGVGSLITRGGLRIENGAWIGGISQRGQFYREWLDTDVVTALAWLAAQNLEARDIRAALTSTRGASAPEGIGLPSD